MTFESFSISSSLGWAAFSLAEGRRSVRLCKRTAFAISSPLRSFYCRFAAKGDLQGSGDRH